MVVGLFLLCLSSPVLSTVLCGVSTSPSILTLGLLLQQPFIVIPRYSPVRAKTVSLIVSGNYVDLSYLLSINRQNLTIFWMGVWFLSLQLRRAPDESRTLRRGKKKEEEKI